MSAHPTSQGPAAGAEPLPVPERKSLGQASSNTISMRWSALHDAAALVATLAGLAPEPPRPTVRNFPAMIRDAGGWRLDLAEEGLDDVLAVMQAGLTALLAANSRGVATTAAARALWQEFYTARSALLALVPTPGAPESRRSA